MTTSIHFREKVELHDVVKERFRQIFFCINEISSRLPLCFVLRGAFKKSKKLVSSPSLAVAEKAFNLKKEIPGSISNWVQAKCHGLAQIGRL